jgi:hypothetical protein
LVDPTGSEGQRSRAGRNRLSNTAVLWCFQSVIRLFFMKTKKIMYFQEDDMFIGWLDDFPDYKTQGATLDELNTDFRAAIHI